MGKGRMVTTKVLFSALTYVTAATFLMVAAGCAEVDLGDRWNRYYDPNHGTGKEDILKHFNLHRGRWWNYYDRGSVYLAYGHYQEAQANFEKAAVKRSRDTRDARTYGMHFIDYFPHRESGVTYYFQGEGETGVATKEKLFRDAICELETSLRQEESSRAKFYLNLARTSLWQVTKEKDTIAPTIRVKKPIYTNQRTVRFDVTVTDKDSYVGDIRIGKSVGDVRIDRPRPFIELAKKEIKATIELTIGSQEKYAVVTVTASDLAGNKSDPNSTLIIVDTQAPTAGVSIVGDRTQTGSPIEVSIEAMDDFGLKQIQVGDDPNHKVDCNGAMKYSGIIAGMPRAGKLAITVVDNAGNTTIAGIPVREDKGQARLARASWLETQRRLPLTKLVGAHNWSRQLSQAHLPGLSAHLPRSSVPLYRGAYTQIASFTVARERTGDGTTVWEPRFQFEDYVKPGQDIPKETSQSSFTVEGFLWNPLDINLIKVNMDRQEIDVRLEPSQREYFMFARSVNLADVPIGETQTIRVEAYREPHRLAPFITETLKVIRLDDVSREADAVYGMLLLPLSLSSESDITAPSRSDWDTSKLSDIYEVVLKEFKSLKMSSRCPSESYTQKSEETLGAFRVYHVREVYRIPKTEAWYKLGKNKGDVVRDLSRWRNREGRNGSNFIDPNGVDPNLIDLVVYGDLKVYNTKNTSGQDREECDITLRAIDVVSQTDLQFPIGKLGKTIKVLTDMTYRIQNMNEHIEQNMKVRTEMLALNAAKRIPRLHADIKADNISVRGAKHTVRFECGRNHGVFRHMRLWLYEKDAPKNAKLTKIDCRYIVDFDFNSSWIECDEKQSLLLQHASSSTVITK